MEKARRFGGESVFNAALILMGFVIAIESLRIGFGTLKSPGSGLFSFLSGLLIAALNSAILFGKKSRGSEIVLDRYGMENFFFMGLTLVLWILLMPLAGYVAITFVATFSLSKILRLEGWLKPLFLSGGTTALCFILFDYVLYLDLPRGFLG